MLRRADMRMMHVTSSKGNHVYHVVHRHVSSWITHFMGVAPWELAKSLVVVGLIAGVVDPCSQKLAGVVSGVLHRYIRL